MLVVVSGPSAAGKTTLCRRLLRDRADIVYSISCTTRLPRGREVDGREYHFLDRASFERKIAEGGFLEHANVHGFYYGTPKDRVLSALSRGASVLMDIDVQGVAQIRSLAADAPPHDLLKESFVDVFVAPPSMDVLRERLVARGEDTPEAMERRLKNALVEMDEAGRFKYVIVNDEVGSAYRQLQSILDREGGRDG